MPVTEVLEGLAVSLAAAGVYSLGHRVPALLLLEDSIASGSESCSISVHTAQMGVNTMEMSRWDAAPASPLRSRLHRCNESLSTCAALVDAGLRQSLASRGAEDAADWVMVQAVSSAAEGSPALARRREALGSGETSRSAIRESFARLIVALEDGEALASRLLELMGILLPPAMGGGFLERGGRGEEKEGVMCSEGGAGAERKGEGGGKGGGGGYHAPYRLPRLVEAAARVAFRVCSPLGEYCPHSGGGATPSVQQRASRAIECSDIPPEARVPVCGRPSLRHSVGEEHGRGHGQGSAFASVLCDEDEDTVLLQYPGQEWTAN